MLTQQTTTDNGSMHNLRIARTTENEMMQLERMVARRLKMHSWGIVGGGLGFFFIA